MDSHSALDNFHKTGALLKGHFKLTSGNHSDTYLQCALLMKHPEVWGAMAPALAERLRAHLGGVKPDAVVGPAIGGIIVAYELSRALGTSALYMERLSTTNKFALRRGFSLKSGDTAVVCEDVVTTGGSAREVVEVLQGMGVKVLAVAGIVDRSGGTVSFGVPFASLVTLNPPLYKPEECPLCKAGHPVETPGSKGV
ncbi:MAG: orotate phosphoribosyltransferase [Candidatus Brocadiia bacterium]